MLQISVVLQCCYALYANITWRVLATW